MTTAYAPGAFSDGARPGAVSRTPSASRDNVVERAHKAASRIRTNEGLRGYSVRTQVLVRYVGYFFLTVVSYLMAKWSFAAIPQWRHGGEMLLYSVCTILTVASIGRTTCSCYERVHAHCLAGP